MDDVGKVMYEDNGKRAVEMDVGEPTKRTKTKCSNSGLYSLRLPAAPNGQYWRLSLKEGLVVDLQHRAC